ncbi:MAG: MmcQ/YjbR family DNA-binding protein [Bacteroidota bacterium]|nr:MmcQ/YjbR family DNA-binding protein [Bacteroidota bacterium]
MINIDVLREIALSFPETTEEPHFEKTSFRVGKKIFATYDLKKDQACIKLSEKDQYVFTEFDKTIIFSVPNKWGKQGWTFVNLKKVSKKMIIEVLTMSYRESST